MQLESKIKIIIADDHQMLVDGIKSLLKGEKKLEVIGVANNGSVALELIEKNQPDILLTDINMPVMSGVELTKKVRAKFPKIKIIALSMFGDQHAITEMLDAGVSGYILKNTGKEELLNAIQTVFDGGVFYSREVSDQMMRSLTDKSKSEAAILTTREIEIVKLIAKECSNIKIAEELFISERTVETHRKNIFRKTNTKSVVGLLNYAREHRII